MNYSKNKTTALIAMGLFATGHLSADVVASYSSSNSDSYTSALESLSSPTQGGSSGYLLESSKTVDSTIEPSISYDGENTITTVTNTDGSTTATTTDSEDTVVSVVTITTNADGSTTTISTVDGTTTLSIVDSSGATVSSGTYSFDTTKYLYDEDTNTTVAVSYQVFLNDDASFTKSRQVISADTDELSSNFANISGSSNGSAIQNPVDYTIDYLNADFLNNSNTGTLGGAIQNVGTINNLKGDFYYNQVTTGDTKGGAIYNSGILGDVTGDFVGNSITAVSSKNAPSGGAIYNTSTATITSISGDFVANYASHTGGTNTNWTAYAGAIYNDGTIGDITGDFFYNYAYSSGQQAYGGAIYNTNTISSIVGDFVGNYTYAVTSGSTASYGGAIYNSSTITAITGDFIANYARAGKATTAYGGAIYNTSAGTIGFLALDDSMEFTGNYTLNSTTYASNAIYNAGTLNFNAYNGNTIVVNDTLNGSSGTVSINGAVYDTYGNQLYTDQTSYSTVELNGSVTNQSITVYNGTLKLGGYDGGYVVNSSYTTSSTTATLSATSILVESGAVLQIGTNSSSDAVTVNATSSITLKSGASMLFDASADMTFGTGATFTIDLSDLILGEYTSFSVDFIFDADDVITEKTVYDFLNSSLTFLFGDDYLTIGDDNSIISEDAGIVDGQYSIDIDEISNTLTISGYISNYTAAVPEPSTYAMILGVIALGFAYYRRRK